MPNQLGNKSHQVEVIQIYNILHLLNFIQYHIVCLYKLATIVKADQKAPFSIATSPRCKEGCYSFYVL